MATNRYLQIVKVGSEKTNTQPFSYSQKENARLDYLKIYGNYFSLFKTKTVFSPNLDDGFFKFFLVLTMDSKDFTQDLRKALIQAFGPPLTNGVYKSVCRKNNSLKIIICEATSANIKALLNITRSFENLKYNLDYEHLNNKISILRLPVFTPETLGHIILLSKFWPVGASLKFQRKGFLEERERLFENQLPFISRSLASSLNVGVFEYSLYVSKNKLAQKSSGKWRGLDKMMANRNRFSLFNSKGELVFDFLKTIENMECGCDEKVDKGFHERGFKDKDGVIGKRRDERLETQSKHIKLENACEKCSLIFQLQNGTVHPIFWSLNTVFKLKNKVGVIKQDDSQKGSHLLNGYSALIGRDPCGLCGMALLHSRISNVVLTSHKEEIQGGGCFLNSLFINTKMENGRVFNHRFDVYLISLKN